MAQERLISRNVLHGHGCVSTRHRCGGHKLSSAVTLHDVDSSCLALSKSSSLVLFVGRSCVTSQTSLRAVPLVCGHHWRSTTLQIAEWGRRQFSKRHRHSRHRDLNPQQRHRRTTARRLCKRGQASEGRMRKATVPDREIRSWPLGSTQCAMGRSMLGR